MLIMLFLRLEATIWLFMKTCLLYDLILDQLNHAANFAKKNILGFVPLKYVYPTLLNTMLNAFKNKKSWPVKL
jgi:hypothetical protein